MPTGSLFAGKETLTYGMTICLGAKRLSPLSGRMLYELASSLRIASVPLSHGAQPSIELLEYRI